MIDLFYQHRVEPNVLIKKVAATVSTAKEIDDKGRSQQGSGKYKALAWRHGI